MIGPLGGTLAESGRLTGLQTGGQAVPGAMGALAFRIVALGIGPTLKGEIMETLHLARAKYLLDRVSNNVKYPTLDGSPTLPTEAAALIECLGKIGLGEDADAMRKDLIVYFSHEVRLPNSGLDQRLVEFRSKANELFGPLLKYSRPEGDWTVVRLRLIDQFDGLRITFKKLSMLSVPLTPPAPGMGAGEGVASLTTQAMQDDPKADFHYEDVLLTPQNVAQCFTLDEKPLFSTSSLQRWEIELPKKFSLPFGHLDVGHEDGKKVYVTSQILAIVAEKTRLSDSASQWAFDPSRVG